MLNPFLAVLILISASPVAQAVYRCQNGPAVTYSDSPCQNGVSADISDRVRDRVAPTDVAEAKERLARQQQFIGHTNAERLKEQAKEQNAAERARKSELRAKVSRDRRCAELALRRKWAHEDAELASLKTKAAAQRKAARATERYDLACKT